MKLYNIKKKIGEIKMGADFETQSAVLNVETHKTRARVIAAARTAGQQAVNETARALEAPSPGIHSSGAGRCDEILRLIDEVLVEAVVPATRSVIEPVLVKPSLLH